MVKKQKATSKKGNDAVTEAENATEAVNDKIENMNQENGVEDASAKKKANKNKAKEKKSEENATKQEEETDEVVENGEEKSDKKKTPAKPKRSIKKETKSHVEPARKSSRTPKPLTKEGDSDASYEVEKIVDCRTVRGQTEYLVRWKGYSRGDDSWEDEADLNGCAELLQKFKSENPGSQKKAKKRPSKSPAKSSAAKKTKKEEKDYEVEEIVGLRIKSGKKEFKVRWKGYKESDDSWEPEKHLSCQDLIEKYLKEHADEVQAEETKKPAKKVSKKAKSPAKSAKGKKTKKK